MIFDIYTQTDLYKIADCARQTVLTDWLTLNGIPYSRDAKGRIIAHKRAVDAGLGAPEPELQQQPQAEMCLED